MTIKKSLLVALLIFMLSSCYGRYYAYNEEVSVKAVFDVTTTIIPNNKKDQNKKDQPQITKNESNVLMGDCAIDESLEGTTKRVDFARDRIFYFDSKGSVISQYSIYADLMFKNMELNNRVNMMRMAKAANLELDGMEDVGIVEHLFSVKLGAKNIKKSSIKKIESDGFVSYFIAGKEVFSYSKNQLTKISRREMSLLGYFLIHNYGIHPEILKEFTKERYMPREIRIKFYEVVKNKEVNLVAKFFDKSPETCKSITSFKYSDSKIKSSDSLAQLMQKSELLRKEDLEKYQKETKEKIIEYAEQKKYFASLLNAIGYLFNSDQDQLPQEIFPYKKEISQDSKAQDLFRIIDRKKFLEDAKGNMKTLDDLLKTSGKDSYVLSLLKAQYLIDLKQESQAQKLLLEVLSKNNIIPDAWILLGRTFMKEYRTHDAWRCYDIARNLSPKSKGILEIEKIERKLRFDNYEFFNNSLIFRKILPQNISLNLPLR